MKPLARTFIVAVCVSMMVCVSGCAVPRAVGKAAGGLVKGTGKVVSGTASAVSKPLR